MKRTIGIALIAAIVLVGLGLLLRGDDHAAQFTENREAWEAYEDGDWLLKSFRYKKAREKLEEAVDLDPDFAMAHAALAELDWRTGERESAEARYVIADSLAALLDDPRTRVLLQVRLGNSGLSVYRSERDSLLDAARELAADHIIVLVSEAGEAGMAGDHDEAERIWKHVLEINPNYAAAYNYLGYLYLGQGRYDEAEATMRRYAFVAPDLANPHDSLGEVLMTRGRYEEAESEFRAALEKQPDFFASLVNIANIYVLRGQVDKANTLLDRLREEVEGTALLHDVEIRRLRLLFEHRIVDDLDRYAARYITENPETDFASYVRIWRHIALGEGEQAMALHDSVMAEHREKDWFDDKPVRRRRFEAQAERYRALIAEGEGDHEAAAERLAAVLDANGDLPVHATAFDRVHFAWNLVPVGRLDEARRLIGEILELNPRLPEAILVAAAIEAASGDTAEAQRLLTTLEQVLDRADADFPPLREAQRMRERLDRPGRI